MADVLEYPKWIGVDQDDPNKGFVAVTKADDDAYTGPRSDAPQGEQQVQKGK